jgi:hypothetical protein
MHKRVCDSHKKQQTRLHPTFFLLIIILDAKGLSSLLELDRREQILIKRESPRKIKNKKRKEK